MNSTRFRLALAVLVIFSHAFEIQGLRDPLETMGLPSCGALAVDAFFALSGYVISGSWEAQPRGYVLRRVARIYPAFAACSLLTVALAPLAGGQVEGLKTLYRIAILHAPGAPGVFTGEPIATMNASMWSIPWEFGCYGLVIFLGSGKVLRHPALLWSIVALCAGLTVAPFTENHLMTRLLACFLTGAAWRVTPFLPRLPPAPKGEDDISYGVYLWGWPALAWTLWIVGPMNPLALFAAATLASFVLGFASWRLIERPAMRLAKGLRFRPATVAA